MERKYDVIIFGATGYTGKYAVRNAVEILKDMKWAVAGRSQAKLEETLRDSGRKINADLSKIPIIIADTNDEESLLEMTKQAKVIANTCGPYHIHGEAVVKACLETGTSHLDVSGEPQFIEKMILKYNDIAREKGVYIGSAMGIESVPAELGILFLQEKFGGTINQVESYMRFYLERGFRANGASLNYGTYHSAIHAIGCFFESQRLRRKIHPNKMPQMSPRLSNRLVHHDEAIRNRWAIPFGEPDETIVNRTQRYLFEKEGLRPIQMTSYMVIPKFIHVLAIILFAPILLILAQFEFGRNILLSAPRLFLAGMTSREGPEERTVEKSEYELILVAHGFEEKVTELRWPHATNKKMIARVWAKNPAYGATSAALLLCAKTIINEGSKLPGGGVHTPGIMFSKTSLLQQLQQNGFTFEIVE